MGSDEEPIQPEETQPNESMQHFLAGVEVVFARGVREGGQAAQGRTARAGFHQLGPVHRHVVLPGGTGAFLARDLRGSGVLRRPLEAFGSPRGANVMRAYWLNPEETALAFRDGLFRTGDIAYQDASGYFYILDRLKDMIVTGGENVIPVKSRP